VAVRVALPAFDETGWTAGAVYAEMIVRSLRGAGDGDLDVVVFCQDRPERWEGVARAVPAPRPSLLDRGMFRFGLPWPDPTERWCLTHKADALLLHRRLGMPWAPFRRIPWIPDFQHKHLPDRFSAEERRRRDRTFALCGRLGDAVLCSSQAAWDDFVRFHPRHAGKPRVQRFPSLYAFNPPPEKLGDAVRRHHLPEKFALVANPFWAQKNHAIVVDAVALLAAHGLRIPVALTGLPADHRDPENACLSALLQRIAQKGLAGQVVPLGLVPRADLTDLMRAAAVVIQPSRFEGWSTSVQDAKALGRPVICSDLPVHREQAPDALGHFGCDDPQGLADILERRWPGLAPGPHLERERAALADHRAFAATHGRALLDLCRGA
jgi:glycosyltransferase involved in cell wall biosynthesis